MLTSALSAAMNSSSSSTSRAIIQAIAGQIVASPPQFDLTSAASVGSIIANAAHNIDPTNQTALVAPISPMSRTWCLKAILELALTANSASDPTAAVAASQAGAQGATSTSLSDPTTVNSLPAAPIVALKVIRAFRRLTE